MRVSRIDLNPGIIFQPYEDNGSATQIIELPQLVDCVWQPTPCSSTWNKNHCQSDVDFAQPIRNGDIINIQTQFLDYQNISPAFSCPPPTEYMHAVAEIEFVNKQTVVYGDSGQCIYYQFSLTFLGCSDVADHIETRLCSYNNFDEWVAGTIDYYISSGVIGGGVVTKIAANRMRIQWNCDYFQSLFGRDICTEEIMHCFYRKTPWSGPESPAAATIPQVNTTFAIECCSPATQCLTIAQGEDGGCSVPEGKMLFEFTIHNSPSYIFGSAAQITANVSDAAIAFVKQSALICPLSGLVSPLLKLSNATDYTNYLDNICTYLTSYYCLPTDVVTCNNVTGEFSILFDVDDNITENDWDPCEDKIRICAPSFEIPKKGGVCNFTPGYKEVEIQISTFHIAIPDTFSLFDSGGNFMWNATGVDNSSHINYAKDIITKFEIAFSNSYAKLATVIFNGSISIKFFISPTDAADVCKGTAWNSNAGIVQNQSLCCDKPCLNNGSGELSFNMPIVKSVSNFPNSTTSYRARFLYSCGNTVTPATPMGNYLLITANSYYDFKTKLVNILNSPGILTVRGYSNTEEWRSTYDRVWLPTSLFPCACEDVNIALVIENYNPGLGIWSEASNVVNFIDCCQSSCEIPPDYVEFNWKVKDEGVIWENSNFYSFLNIVPQNAECSDYNNDALSYSVKTSEATSLADYCTKWQAKLNSYFDLTFSGQDTRTSVQLIKGIDYYEFRMRTYRYHGVYGDLCEGLKLCPGYNSGEGGFQCFSVVGIRFLTLMSYILEDGVYKFSYNLRLDCNNASGITGTYTKTIAFNLYSLPTLDDVFTAFVNKMNMLGLATTIIPAPPPYTLEFKIHEDLFACRCANDMNYITGSLSNTPDSAIDHYGKTSHLLWYKGQQIAYVSGGDGIMVTGYDELFTADCCDVCINPFGYVSIPIETDFPSVNSFSIGFVNSDDCELSFEYSQPNPFDLIKMINTKLFPNVYAEGYGNIATIFVRNPDNCSCTLDLYVEINGSGGSVVKRHNLNCCEGEGIIGSEQLVDHEITKQQCCPDFVSAVELVDCCCNTIPDYDVRTALTGHLFGQNLSPLMFFQNYEFDSALIPFDCFAFKFTSAQGEVHYTECFKKDKCIEIVELCSEYPEGKRDCNGMIYGLPEFGCPAVLTPIYTNCCKFPASLQITSYNFRNPKTTERTVQEYYTIRTALLPPYMIEKLTSILGGKNITVNGKNVSFEGAINKDRDSGDMWVVTLELIGEECSVGTTCD